VRRYSRTLHPNAEIYRGISIFFDDENCFQHVLATLNREKLESYLQRRSSGSWFQR